MKQHILPEQAKEITKEQFYKLYNNTMSKNMQLPDRIDWYNYHHKKITIGKMIEILNNRKVISVAKDGDMDTEWWVVSFVDKSKTYNNYELSNALWDAVKEIL